MNLRKLMRGYSDLTEAQKACCCDLALVALSNSGLLSVDPEQRNESLDFLRRAADETPARSASVIFRALRSYWRSSYPAKKRYCIYAAKALNAMPLEGFDRRMVQQLVRFHKNLAGTIGQWKEPHGLDAEDQKESHRVDLLLRPVVGKILGRLKREGLYEPDV